jgi:hypothetical protein
MVARKKIIAANWKMNHTHREAKSYADLLWAEVGVVNEIEVVLIPPFTAIPALAEAVEKKPVARLGAKICTGKSPARSLVKSAPRCCEPWTSTMLCLVTANGEGYLGRPTKSSIEKLQRP